MIDEIDLAAMVADHAGLTRLCADLETVADELPDPPDSLEAARLRDDLLQWLPAHDARERAMMRHLFRNAGKSQPGPALLREIESRRAACLVQGQDIAIALVPGDMPATANTFGYMLRCFFQSCRQAMAFEELAILHLAGERLTADARRLLIGSLARRCGD